MLRSPTLLSIALALLAGGCRSTPEREIAGLYQRAVRDAKEDGGFAALSPRSDERMAESRAKIRELHAQGALESAEDHLRSAFILSTSSDVAELELAHDLAIRAGELGADRGWPLAAEVLDKALYLRGLPQRYGTQFVYEPVLAKWRLYPVDPTTTDRDRTELGLPTLAELRAYEDELNRQHASGD